MTVFSLSFEGSVFPARFFGVYFKHRACDGACSLLRLRPLREEGCLFFSAQISPTWHFVLALAYSALGFISSAPPNSSHGRAERVMWTINPPPTSSLGTCVWRVKRVKAEGSVEPSRRCRRRLPEVAVSNPVALLPEGGSSLNYCPLS